MARVWAATLVAMVMCNLEPADAQLNGGGGGNATACAVAVRTLCASSTATNNLACLQCVRTRSQQLVAAGCTSAHGALVQTVCNSSTSSGPQPTASPPPATPPTTAGPALSLVLVPGSHCSDGSPAGYYYSPPPNGSSTTWVIDLKGGGGCRFRSDCLQRAQTEMGSSLNWAATTTWSTLGRGYLSPDPQVNPDFHFAHKVYVPYCTGDAHAGNRRIADNSSWNLYFSGHANLEDFVAHLNATRGLASGTHVMFTGSSAGAIGVYRNANWLGSVLSHAFVAANPIDGWFFSGFFGSQPSWQPPPPYPAWLNGSNSGLPPSPPANDSVSTVFNYSNNEYWIDPACAAAQGPGNESRCATQTVLFPFITIPVFVSQRQFDASMLSNLDTPTPLPRLGSTSSVATYVSLVGDSVRRSLELVNGSLSAGKVIPDGLFSPSCYGHVGGLNWASFVISIGNFTSRQVVGDWFWQRNSLPHIVRGATSLLPSNPSCSAPRSNPPPPPPNSGNGTACASAAQSLCASQTTTPTLCVRCTQNRSRLLVAAGCDMTHRTILAAVCNLIANSTGSTVATSETPTPSDSSVAPTDSTGTSTPSLTTSRTAASSGNDSSNDFGTTPIVVTVIACIGAVAAAIVLTRRSYQRHSTSNPHPREVRYGNPAYDLSNAIVSPGTSDYEEADATETYLDVKMT